MVNITLRGEQFSVPENDTVGIWYTLAKAGAVKPNPQLDDPIRAIDFAVRFVGALIDKPVEWFDPLEPKEVIDAQNTILETWGKNRPPVKRAETPPDTGESSTD